jgi:hypothetical protein
MFSPSTKNNIILKNTKIYENFYKNYEAVKSNIYFLPCLIHKDNVTETQYLEKLKKELSELQVYLKQNFQSKIENQQTPFKNINFFCDMNGNVALGFYKHSFSQNTVQLLNKFIFKELVKLKGDIMYGKQKFELTEKITQPLIYKKNRRQLNQEYTNDDKNKFLAFLVQNILTGEILSNFKGYDILNFEGIHKLNIIFSANIKRDMNEFYMGCNKLFRFTEKKFKYFHLDFKLSKNECQYVEKYKKETNIFQKYWKIDIQNVSDLQNSELDEESEYYLRVTSNNVLKHASIYTKNRNIYEEKMKGIIQLAPNQQHPVRQFQISNVSRILQTRNIYFYENFNFTMESFKKYVESRKDNTNSQGKSSKSALRNSFIETFSNKKLLNDYFVFCSNDPKWKKQIDFDYFKTSDINTKNKTQKKIVRFLIKELFKKGSKFYIHQNNNQEKKSTKAMNNRTYNKYIIKNIKKDIIVQLASETAEKKQILKNIKERVGNKNMSNFVNNYGNMFSESKQNKYDYSFVQINLEIDTNKDDNQDDFLNKNLLTVKSNKEKCLKRKKLIKNTTQKLLKNATQTMYFNLRPFT